jgi:rare lipoprotein A
MFSKIKKIVTIIGLSSFSFLPLNAYAYSGCTTSSYYGVGDGFHGRTTANGESFNAYGHTTAHKSLPFGTRVRVTNQSNGKSVIVRVNDSGPYVAGRTLDLSYGAFSSIASPSQGVARVCYTRL